MLEKHIQSELIQRLKGMGIFVSRHNPIRLIGNKQFLRLQDSEKGHPDLICCMHGRYLGIEVKTIDGELSTYQKQRRLEIELAGGIYLVVRSVDDGIRQIRELQGQLALAL